jgi:hypothetical protein
MHVLSHSQQYLGVEDQEKDHGAGQREPHEGEAYISRRAALLLDTTDSVNEPRVMVVPIRMIPAWRVCQLRGLRSVLKWSGSH